MLKIFIKTLAPRFLCQLSKLLVNPLRGIPATVALLAGLGLTGPVRCSPFPCSLTLRVEKGFRVHPLQSSLGDCAGISLTASLKRFAGILQKTERLLFTLHTLLFLITPTLTPPDRGRE